MLFDPSSKLFIITSPTLKNKISFNENVFFIGVDSGCEYIIKNSKKISNNLLAIGDFDSISKKYLQNINKYFLKVVSLPKEKDKTDLHIALNYIFKNFNISKIYIFSDGERKDHLIFNLFLIVKKFSKNFFKKVIYFDNHNIFFLLTKGEHKIKKKLPYFSLFSFTNSIITCKNCKWPLIDQKINKNNLSTISNEFLTNELIIKVKKNYVFLVQSKD